MTECWLVSMDKVDDCKGIRDEPKEIAFVVLRYLLPPTGRYVRVQ